MNHRNQFAIHALLLKSPGGVVGNGNVPVVVEAQCGSFSQSIKTCQNLPIGEIISPLLSKDLIDRQHGRSVTDAAGNP